MLLLLAAGCASVPPPVVGHYQGNWEVGAAYEGFYSLDDKLVCDLEDMPVAYDRYFLRPGTPTYHARDGTFFSAAYVEVDGYLTSGYDPAVGVSHRVLHVVRVDRVGRATAGYLRERTGRPR